MKKSGTTVIASICSLYAMAGIINVTDFNHYGPFTVKSPVMIDSTDIQSKKFDFAKIVDSHYAVPSSGGRFYNGALVPSDPLTYSVNTLVFDVENEKFAKANLNVSGIGDYKIYVDDKKIDGTNLTLSPATHRVAIRFISTPGQADSLKISLESNQHEKLIVKAPGKRKLSMQHILHGMSIGATSISPDGRYVITAYNNTVSGGKSDWVYKVFDIESGKVISTTSRPIAWMPRGSRYYYVGKGVNGSNLVAVDAASGQENIVAEGIPGGSFTISPDESFLVYSSCQKGGDDGDVYQIINPEDRQPGWRNRWDLSLYDLNSRIMQPLTYGHTNVALCDISRDSKKILLQTSRGRLSKRPTTVFDLMLVDLSTMKVDTLVKGDGFIGSAVFSPDGKKVLISGSPESLDGIGMNVPEGRIPSMIDNQLFIMSLEDKKVKPMTRDFNPSVTDMQWSVADGMIYFTAENRDCYTAYRLNPTNGAIAELPIPEDLVKGISVPCRGSLIAAYGQGVSNPDRLYVLNTKNMKATMLDEPKREMMSDVELGTCEEWTFVNSRGDSICGRYYLPANFDPAKKYPMIVNYYGGCSPSSRHFDSRYPHNVYAGLGYIVYVIQPSGATGFGQEFSSRHVNTAGEGVAQDIIEGTRRFCESHPYVDASKIGCIGASYGGFMTQYLQTQTDIFAAAISHAGISDHTSYWGEGYWGYSYSETSMAGKYPWTDTDLYVKQSPLYNVDKINTPLLFLHGDSDTNVPIGESIQMFTAMKLLGKETAFVAVGGENHHIVDYNKRQKWQDTIFAWFAKYLQDDPSWWNELYPEKQLTD